MSRVRRRTVEEVRAERESWDQSVNDSEDEDAHEDDLQTTVPQGDGDDEYIQWDEWVDAERA